MAATKLSQYKDACRLIGDVRLDSLLDDVPVRYLLDDAWLGSVEFCLRSAPWRFALKEVALSTTIQPLNGFSVAYEVPAEWLRTHALYVPVGELRRPVDCRDQKRKISANVTDLHMRFVSSEHDDPALSGNPWPEHFSAAQAAHLAFQVADAITNSRGTQSAMSELFGQLLQVAVAHDAEPEDEWLRYQLDGSFQRALRDMLSKGYWAFALKRAEFQAPPITMPPPLAPIIGYNYSFSLPDDLVMTRKVFVPAGDGRERPIDFAEDSEQWSTDKANPYFVAEYVSSDLGLNPERWTEPFLTALHTYLTPPTVSPQGQQSSASINAFERALAAALASDGEPENPWYRFQRNGAFLRACFHVAETGRWKFAIETVDLTANATINADGTITGTLPANVWNNNSGAISPSYSCVFAKPNDWFKHVWMYESHPGQHPAPDMWGWPERHDIDFRDEGGCWHTNHSHIQVRYIRRAVIEPWRWPQTFENAVRAWLEYEEVREKPEATSVANAKLTFYEDLINKAESRDDERERAPYKHVGRFIRARYMTPGSGRGEHGWGRG